jgi:hypothetical protein
MEKRKTQHARQQLQGPQDLPVLELKMLLEEGSEGCRACAAPAHTHLQHVLASRRRSQLLQLMELSRKAGPPSEPCGREGHFFIQLQRTTLLVQGSPLAVYLPEHFLKEGA